MTKDELASAYKISPSTLRNLLNKRYFPQLQPLGYRKNDKILSPMVIRKFIEIYDKPFNRKEFEDEN